MEQVSPEQTTAHEIDQLDQSVFVLRAHHLNKLISFARFGVAESNERMIHEQMTMEDGPTSGPAYVGDIFGKNEAQKQQVTRRHQEIFSHFMALPDNTSVHLTDLPDEICEACVIGEHCKGGQMDWYTKEGFTRASRAIARNDNVAPDSLYYTGADGSTLVTTKKVVTSVIANVLAQAYKR